ncbi:hypothetical protein [Stackebrandtia nassauensis]|uniref:hypothetical protein n=1 Tax=Stackebrandtia nassauensis TaxID=283811 RepID=UPI0001A39E18|nr:hypothetical protein [Stackebrandtia nassauensis]
MVDSMMRIVDSGQSVSIDEMATEVRTHGADSRPSRRDDFPRDLRELTTEAA